MKGEKYEVLKVKTQVVLMMKESERKDGSARKRRRKGER